ISHGRTLLDGAIDGGAPKRAICGSDCTLCSGKIEVADVSVVVHVNTKQSVSFDIPEKVGAEHHARTNLPLYAEVHLKGARSLVVGREDSQGNTQSRIEEVLDVVGVVRLQV